MAHAGGMRCCQRLRDFAAVSAARLCSLAVQWLYMSLLRVMVIVMRRAHVVWGRARLRRMIRPQASVVTDSAFRLDMAAAGSEPACTVCRH
jgi:hypothetical protein